MAVCRWGINNVHEKYLKTPTGGCEPYPGWWMSRRRDCG
jgi:hypothetical protein